MSNQVPLSEATGDKPVTLINAFTVPLHESDRFLRRWKENARIMAGQPTSCSEIVSVRSNVISHCSQRYW
jgi:hypothetical protein